MSFESPVWQVLGALTKVGIAEYTQSGNCHSFHNGKNQPMLEWMGGACTSTPFHRITIMYQGVAVYAPAERTDTPPPPHFISTLYVLCGGNIIGVRSFYSGDPDVIVSCLTCRTLSVWLCNACSLARHWQINLSVATWTHVAKAKAGLRDVFLHQQKNRGLLRFVCQASPIWTFIYGSSSRQCKKPTVFVLQIFP